jgi:hypothetical protein
MSTPGEASSPAPIAKGQAASRDEAGEPRGEDRPDHPEPIPRGNIGEARPPAPPDRDGWGEPIDPDGDCRFAIDPDRNQTRIAIPGTPHVLSAELGRRNAPRLLRPVRGDFDVTVSVDGVSRPSGRATTKEYPPYHGAGILLWQDGRNYVRLEIAADIHRGKPRSYTNFELRKGGALAVSRGLEIKDGSTRLRLERRGSEVRAAFGPDGDHWTWFEPLAVEFDERLGVGIAAINSASKPLDAGLNMFAITRIGRAGEGKLEGSVRPPRPEAGPLP